MASSENSVRRLAEKIHRLSRETISGTPEEMEREEVSQIESLLSEAMAEAYAHGVKTAADAYKETVACQESRSAAYRDAAEIAAAFGDDCCDEIADKLRWKANEVGKEGV